MYNKTKHQEVMGKIGDLFKVYSNDEATSEKQLAINYKMYQAIKDINTNLVTLINLIKDNYYLMDTFNQGMPMEPKGPEGTVTSEPLHNVSVKPDSTEEQEEEEYQSPDEPVYKHFYYYDVTDVTDDSHSKYSRLADIASDLGASDSAPHYAMVNGTLFLGRYRINKIDTKVKVNVKSQHKNEEDSDLNKLEIF